MTERKPSGMTFTSWIDQQISAAEEQGAFDHLPGAGKPLPNRPDDDGQAWLRGYLEREGVSADELLPPPLKLRKERARLLETVAQMSSEQEVRESVSELNRRIAEWRRIPVGPPIFVPLVDAGEMIRLWHAARPHPPAPQPAAEPGQLSNEAAAAASARRSWTLRRSRRGR